MNELAIVPQTDKSPDQMAAECLNSFEEVVSVFQPKLQKFIFSIVGETELAHDLTQDTFLVAFSHLQNRVQQFNSSLSSPGLIVQAQRFNLSSWLYTIAHNKAIDAVRRQRKIAYTGSDALLDYQSSSQAASLNKSIESWLVDREELEQAINKVGPQKLNYFLMYHNGFSYLEIAEMFGTSLSKVKGKIFRAKKSLREALTEKSNLLAIV
jgi:RNA polymerase sigma-70 factor (ECF subfamily)